MESISNSISPLDYADVSDETFSDSFDLHPDLLAGLHSNNFIYSSHIQLKVLESGILDGESTLVGAEAGSGKTLCFLIPILNQVFKERDAMEAPKPDEELFKNAEIMYAKRKKRLSIPLNTGGPTKEQRGAIILASSRELLNQIYGLIRRLDTKNSLRINRIGSSVQLFSPIVEHLTPESAKKGKRELIAKDVDQVSVQNLVNNASWDLNDIVLTTPAVMKFIIDEQSKYDPYSVNPSIIAMDEFDLLLSNPGMAKQMLQIVRKFAGSSDQRFADANQKRQFILTGATITKQISKKDPIETIENWFPGINIELSEKLHQTSERVNYNWVDVERLPLNPEKYLLDLVKETLDHEKGSNVVIFCNSKASCDDISELLFNEEIPNLPYYADLDSKLRVATLQKFYSGECRVIIATDLLARGIDTCNTQHVIEYEFSSNTTKYIHRVGRTGRMGSPGKVTSFIRGQERDLALEIKERQEDRASLEDTFSRRGSFRAKHKR